MPKSKTFDEILKDYSTEGLLYEKLENNKVHCFACGHLCTAAIPSAHDDWLAFQQLKVRTATLAEELHRHRHTHNSLP